MSTTKTTAKIAVKKTTTSTSASPKQSPKKDLLSVNLSQFADKLKDKNVERTQKDREHIYLYPETFSLSDLNSEKGKKFRQGLRNKLQRFCNNFFFYTKAENVEKLKEEKISFNLFYKENYRTNDYSVKSLTNSPKESAIADVTLMLEIIATIN